MALAMWLVLTWFYILAAPFHAFGVVAAGFRKDAPEGMDPADLPSAVILPGRWSDQAEFADREERKGAG